MMALAFDHLLELVGNQLGVFDRACPLCLSRVSNSGRPRRVIRIWREHEDFARYYCTRCGEKGWAKSDVMASSACPVRLAAFRRDAGEQRAGEQTESLRKARWLWQESIPVTPGTPVYNYLRETRRYHGPVPPTLRYVRPRKAEHHHAMIAAIGMAHELEPRVYSIGKEAIVAVHLTLLQPDGRAKAENVAEVKLNVGQGSLGFPICLIPFNDLLGLVITEGIEDALSSHEGTGLGAWAAGCASRLPALARRIPPWIGCVTIAAHSDPAGRKGALALAAALRARGIEVILQGLSP